MCLNRKPRRRFEQKSLADFTILRSAPLKKHHVHEVLGKKLAERNRRCQGREQGVAWMLAHPKFKQLTIARFWKQFKPLALENIEATRLLQRLRASATGSGNGSDGRGRGSGGGMFGGGGSEEDGGVSVDGGGSDGYNREEGVNVPTATTTNGSGDTSQMFGVQVMDKTPWLHEHEQFGFMWITRPQFIHHMRILMSLNETHNNLRALNRMFSSFDVDVEDKMNAREFCIVLGQLRDERKRSVWAGKTDINPIFENARILYRSETKMMGKFDHHM